MTSDRKVVSLLNTMKKMRLASGSRMKRCDRAGLDTSLFGLRHLIGLPYVVCGDPREGCPFGGGWRRGIEIRVDVGHHNTYLYSKDFAMEFNSVV